MRKADVIIAGAGAAGLMAGCLLVKAGKKVIVLEARNRCGGRIHTVNDEDFFKHAELGAEFIHGDLPVTLELLNEANIPYEPAAAEMWSYKDGTLKKSQEFVKNWEMLLEKLGELKYDMSIEDFLESDFPGEEHGEMKESVRKFVSGYDTADPAKASAFALRKEWQSEDEGAQHRIAGGYGMMIKYLENEIRQHGGEVFLKAVVKDVYWRQDDVKVTTEDGEAYEADKLVIALPLGVLQADGNTTGSLTFEPPIEAHIGALKKMSFGAVIKVLLMFDEIFWEDDITKAMAGEGVENMGYLFSDEQIPTWWTQAPQRSPVLTGWIGGPDAFARKDTTIGELLAQSLQSLCNIFKRNIEEIKGKLISYQIINWTSKPFTLGSYAYDTVDAPSSRKILNTQIENTIFFAGEYLYEGTAMGTVEAALTSGKEVAERMIKSINIL